MVGRTALSICHKKHQEGVVRSALVADETPKEDPDMARRCRMSD